MQLLQLLLRNLMNSYFATKHKPSEPAHFVSSVIGRIPGGSGLCIPKAFARLEEPAALKMRFYSYQELCFRASRGFVSDAPYSLIRKMIRSAYGCRCFNNAGAKAKMFLPVGISVLKVRRVSLFLVELTSGCSLSFKDMAMQALGTLFDCLLNHPIKIISATSGDTGSAACYALRRKRYIKLYVFSPLNKMADFQTEQMYGSISKRVHNLCVGGKFDCCQNIVKQILSHNGCRLSTVNSINWGRIVFQASYFLFSYLRTSSFYREGATFIVPSGNFGNTFSAIVAHKIGLPIKSIIVSTNENNVLEEFLKTGRYNVRSPAETLSTNCPSMDISKASNIERLIFGLLNNSCNILNTAFCQVGISKTLDLLQFLSYKTIRNLLLRSDSTMAKERILIIRSFYRRHGMLLDTHTANSIKTAVCFSFETDLVIVIETAHPLKVKDSLKQLITCQHVLGSIRKERQSKLITANLSHALVSIK